MMTLLQSRTQQTSSIGTSDQNSILTKLHRLPLGHLGDQQGPLNAHLQRLQNHMTPKYRHPSVTNYGWLALWRITLLNSTKCKISLLFGSKRSRRGGQVFLTQKNISLMPTGHRDILALLEKKS